MQLPSSGMAGPCEGIWWTQTRLLLSGLMGVVILLPGAVTKVTGLPVGNPAGTDPLTFAVDLQNEEQTAHLASIIDALEFLGILDSSHERCYTLDKITQSRVPAGSTKTTIAIFFHVEEIVNGKGRPWDVGNQTENGIVTSSSANANTYDSDNQTGELGDKCLGKSTAPMPSSDMSNSVTESGLGHFPGDIDTNGNNTNSTGPVVVATMSPKQRLGIKGKRFIYEIIALIFLHSYLNL